MCEYNMCQNRSEGDNREKWHIQWELIQFIFRFRPMAKQFKSKNTLSLISALPLYSTDIMLRNNIDKLCQNNAYVLSVSYISLLKVKIEKFSTRKTFFLPAANMYEP